MAAKRAKPKAGGGDESGPPIVPFSITPTKEEFEWMLTQPALVACLPLNKAVVWKGVTYLWQVMPFRMRPNGPEALGAQALCRDEAAAKVEQARWVEKFRREQERPVPGETLNLIFVVNSREISMTGTPLSLALGTPKNFAPSASAPPPDVPLVDIANAYWRGQDGSGQAMKGAITKVVNVVHAFRLVRYNEPFQVGGRAFPYGVEYANLAELSLTSEVFRVSERILHESEDAARAMMKKKEIEAPKLRAKLLHEPVKSAEELKEEATIREVQALADRAHDPAAKARHLRRIEEIRKTQQERARVAAEAAAEQARARAAEIEAFNILMDDNFPTVAKVKAERKAAKLPPTAQYWESVRRAMKIDCARLGISSPFNQFAMDDKFTVDVTKALKSKSPIKADQVTAVLNWVSKDYQSMKEEEWTAHVAEKIKAPVKPGGLGKTISKKFGLKSKLKGRPETGTPPNN